MTHKSKKWVLISSRILLAIIVPVFLVVVLVLFWPISSLSVNLHSLKNLSFAEAEAKVKQIQAQEKQLPLNPACQSKLLSHQEKKARTILLFHGYTNCPAQYDLLAEQLFQKGYNVYIPRLPLHGLHKNNYKYLSLLSAQTLARSIATQVEIASGLGNQVSVLGISGGAVMAAWAAYHYPNIDRAVIAAPLFAPLDYPNWQLTGVHNFLRVAPSIYREWESQPVPPDQNQGPEYAYDSYSVNAIAAFLHLGIDLEVKLNRQPNDQLPTKHFAFFLLQNDQGVNNQVAKTRLEQLSNAGASTSLHVFSDDKKLNHDFIDPNQPYAQPELVYPLLIQQVN